MLDGFYNLDFPTVHRRYFIRRLQAARQTRDSIPHFIHDLASLSNSSAPIGRETTIGHHRDHSSILQTTKTMSLSSLSSALIQELSSSPYDIEALLKLEMDREPIDLESSRRPDFQDSLSRIRVYFEKLNKVYPCVSPLTWSHYYHTALSQGFCKGPESCIVLLVIAIGSLIPQKFEGDPPGLAYFAAAWGILPKVMLRNNLVAVQSQVLAALYLMHIFRYLEAWNMLAGASLKLQLLMRRPERLSTEEEELGSRVYWSAAMIESDLLAELDLPQTGLSRLEERFPLPLALEFFERSTTIRHESHYFLADLTLRRIHTHMSAMLYRWTSQYSTHETQGSIAQLELMIHELDHQLNKWYTQLPLAMNFPLHRVDSLSPAQATLRLRYFACRTIIFQPYVLLAFQNESLSMDSEWQDKCHKCLEACVRQLEHITLQSSRDLPYLSQKTFS